MEEITPGANCPGTIKHLLADWTFFRKGSKAVDQDDLERRISSNHRIRDETTTIDVYVRCWPSTPHARWEAIRFTLEPELQQLGIYPRNGGAMRQTHCKDYRQMAIVGKEKVGLPSKGIRGTGNTLKSVSGRGP